MKTDYFTFLDIVPAVLWLIIILAIGSFTRSRNSDKPHYDYYMRNLYAKLFFSLAYALFYIIIVKGGDTVAYFDGAVKLNNLFFKSPTLYLEEMANLPDTHRYITHYDIHTGYPPIWIYREPQAFFVSKLMSILSFFTFKSYFAMTFLMAYLTSIGSWKLFEFIRSYKISNERILAFGILLLPSVNFWCSGISKDTVAMIAVLFLIVNSFSILSVEKKTTFWNIVTVIITSYIIFQVRAFLFIAFFIPFAFVASSKLVRGLGGGTIVLVVLRTLVLGAGLFFVTTTLISQSEEDFLNSNAMLQEASVIQNDFAKNDTYGDKKYDLGDVEFSPIGLIRAAPLVIITGVFRPFIWESFNLTLIMNGVESLIILYFIFRFISSDPIKKIKKVLSHEFLIFSFIFVLIIAYMTGLTSILFGVLVRLRAPLLPFLFVILTVDWSKIEFQKKKKEHEEDDSSLEINKIKT